MIDDEHICYIAGASIFGLGLLAFLLQSWSKSVEYYYVYIQNAIGVGIMLALFTMYFLLEDDQTKIERADGVFVYWGRYIVYAIAFGCTAYHLAFSVGLPKITGFLFAAFVIVGFLLIANATVTPYNGRWRWYALGVLFMLVGSFKVFIHCGKAQYLHAMSYRFYISLSWFVYPVIWALGQAGASIISPFLEALLYLIADICAFLLLNRSLCVCKSVILPRTSSFAPKGNHYYSPSKLACMEGSRYVNSAGPKSNA